MNNNRLAQQVVQQVIDKGVREFCISPGARNAPLVYALSQIPFIKLYHWPEERSSAFFALGRIKATGKPVAVVTTSGTAAAELLPAAVEAHYTSLPLLLMTADRPKRYRGSGAPQSIEQVGLFSYYCHYMQDLADTDLCCLNQWMARGPAHLNICFEEPKEADCQSLKMNILLPQKEFEAHLIMSKEEKELDQFLEKSYFPFIVVGALDSTDGESVISFLLRLKAPVYLEAQSGLREDSRLESIRIESIERLWELSTREGYPIDGVLRIGGIPTARLWRDLEEGEGKRAVCSISEHPFSGLSWAGVIHTSISFFLENWQLKQKRSYPCHAWIQADRLYQNALLKLFEEEPLAEPSLFHILSKRIPQGSKVYIGNSLPIREWDQAAVRSDRRFRMAASRGANGIDGQLATFLGFCSQEQENWAILGDLTALYDMVAPWVLNQMPVLNATVVIVNNGGGQIFARMFAHQDFRNEHHLCFKPLADFWNWHYEKWEAIPDAIAAYNGGRFIELMPDQAATNRFLKKMKQL